MDKTFIETHGAATAIVAATVLASPALEWVVSSKRRLGAPVETAADRGTKRLVIGSMLLGIALGYLAARTVPAAELPGNGWIYIGVGVALIWLGIGLRLWAISVLGRFFQLVVVVQAEQRVIDEGPYRVVRHPAYAGNLLAAAGLGVALANWLSLGVVILIPLAGHIARIRVEEAELERGLGRPYLEYEARTYRLVPGVW